METTTFQENDAEPSFLTLLDLMTEVWEASRSATRNIRLLIAMISSYMARCGKTQCNTRRMREGREMKRILLAMYGLWVTKGTMDAVCPTREMQLFVKCNAPKEFLKGIMIEETFNEWVNEYRRQHVGRSERDSAIDAERNKNAEDDGGGGGLDDGLDALFESVAEPISQNVTRLQDGKLQIVRTPGEMGTQLVRVYVYDVEDIKNVEKRNWWKRAKLRAQFLHSSAKTDPKHLALCKLLDLAASDLLSVRGVVKETREPYHSTDTYSERMNGKRRRDDVITTTSGNYAKRAATK